MSVTFSVEDSPCHEVPFLDFDGNPMVDDDGSAIMCLQSTLPEVNIGNDNTKVIFDTLGLEWPEDSCGEFKLDELPDLRRRIVKALNSDNSIFERKPSITGGMKIGEVNGTVITLCNSMRVYTGGIDVDGIKRRLNSLFEVVESAQLHKKSVVFA